MGKRKDDNGNYDYKKKGGQVHVSEMRTAPGQKTTVGIFNIASRTWENDKHLPSKIRKEVEEQFRP